MGISIEDVKHCLKVMVDCEVCEECNLYGTTGTDHCEHDCVYGALDIIDKYQKIVQIVENVDKRYYGYSTMMDYLHEVIQDGND